jgi:tRNA(Phe) wybutosine-synthesizing methylase Tyw3
MSDEDLKKRLSDATTRLVELDYVEVAISIDLSLAHRDESCLPRLVEEVEYLVALTATHQGLMRPWVEVEEERVRAS